MAKQIAPPDQLFRLIESERLVVADLLEGLTPEQLSTSGACGRWTVQEVAGHLTTGWNVSLPKFALGMIRHRGFDGFNHEAGCKLGDRPIGEIVADIRTNAGHRFTPPGAGPEAPLSDVMIHAAELRDALGLEQVINPEAASLMLGWLATPPKPTVFPLTDSTGLHFVASDMSWESGSGATVEGPSAALLLALAGRETGFGQLTGDGVDLFRERAL